MMATRMNLYKIVAVILVFLIFLQYLYLYPVKLSFNYAKPPSLAVDVSLENSLFYIKTGSTYSKRSPHDLLTSLSTSTHLLQEDARSSANTKNIILGKVTSIRYYNKSETIRSTPGKEDRDVRSNSSNGTRDLSTNVSPAKSIVNTQAPRNKTTDSNHVQELPLCPTRPSTLLGNVRVILKEPPSLAGIGRIHSDLALGGRSKPASCRSKDRVAIIVPFRDREEHLRTFLYNILPFLKRQQIEFNIFVIEQGSASKEEPFNRAMLFNVGFMEASKRGEFDCFIFHDVDLIPENDYNLYNCPQQPRHMSVAVDKMKYKLPYRNIFGGIAALTKAHFIKVNGFSNSFWGWGAEDDDMAGRIAFNGLYISRPPPNIARYKMLKHKQQKLNTQRYRVLQKGKQRFKSDGLSSLKYAVEQVILEKTYTLVRVQLVKL